MGFFDRLLGNEPEPQQRQAAPRRTDDEIAVERYQYLLRTAPPETIEKVHTEAFAKLTPEQRDILFNQLKADATPGDQPENNSPEALARSATRTEVQQPGTLQRSFNGPSFGAMVGSSILGTVAGYVIGSALVSAFMPMDGGADASADSGDAGADSGDAGADTASADGGGDFGGGDFGGGDFGGDFGGF